MCLWKWAREVPLGGLGTPNLCLCLGLGMLRALCLDMHLGQCVKQP